MASRQDRDDWAVSATESDVWGTRMGERSAGANRASGSADRWRSIRDAEVTCTTESEGGPEVTIPGVAVLGRNIYEPTARDNWRFQFSDVVSRASGTHMMKAGTSFTYLSQQARTPLEFGGSFTFAPLPAIPGLLPVPISALEAFALGLPALYVRGFGNSSGPFSYQEFSAFAQDDWRATPRLTVKAGVRYQFQVWPALDTTVSNVGGTTLSYPFPQDHNNLAPRLAASFDLTGDGRTSIDAAYGIFYGSQLATILGSQIVFDGSTDGVRLLVASISREHRRLAGARSSARRAGGPVPELGRSRLRPDLQTPYAHQTSIGLTQRFGDRLHDCRRALFA